MKLLVVDDDVSMLALLEIMFQELGHDTVLVSGGEEALIQLEDQQDFDLVLTDLRMPGLDGLGLLERIRASENAVPCAVMSVLNDMAMVIKSLQLNAIDYLPKPVTEAAICDLLKRVEALTPAVTVARRLPSRFERYQIELPSSRAWVPDLCRHVVSGYLGDQRGDVRETVRLALHEALMNAVIHGNFEISSEAKEEGRWHDFEAEVQASEEHSALSERPVDLQLQRTPDSLWLQVTDVGHGFDPAQLPAADDDAVLNFSGRGITLIRHCMDEVNWNPDGTSIEMRKLNLAERRR